MTIVRDIYNFLDSIAPFATQMAFDNSGLQVGSWEQPVERAMLCLDVTPEAVAQAAQAGCQLIISHHPVLFRARKQLLGSDPAWLLARHGIAAIATHTPADAMAGGVNDLLAAALGLRDVVPFGDCMRLGAVPSCTAAALAAFVGQALAARVRYADAGRRVERLAICGGAGCSFLQDVVGQADAFLVGDADHHDFLEARQNGVSLLAAGHFETEILLAAELARRLKPVFLSVTFLLAIEESVIHYA